MQLSGGGCCCCVVLYSNRFLKGHERRWTIFPNTRSHATWILNVFLWISEPLSTTTAQRRRIYEYNIFENKLKYIMSFFAVRNFSRRPTSTLLTTTNWRQNISFSWPLFCMRFLRIKMKGFILNPFILDNINFKIKANITDKDRNYAKRESFLSRV